MSVDPVVSVISNPAYVAKEYFNPKRRRKGKKGRGHRRNPTYQYMNPSYENPASITDTFFNGSAITQDVRSEERRVGKECRL